ncbi:MAG: glycoside hydrolase family 65 protein, partial [Microthrixaceae bacterium]
MNKTPLWERAMSGFAQQRSEFPDFDWNSDSLVHRDRRGRHIAEAETLFAVTNGFLGVRGAFEEDEPTHERATLINGFHETWPIVYGEAAYGFAKNGQTIVPVPDPTTMKLYIDDEPFRMDNDRVKSSKRTLDWRAGIVTREVEFETADGRRIALRTRRFASLEHRPVFVLDYQVEMLDAPATVTIASELALPRARRDAAGEHDPRRAKTQEGVLQPISQYAEDDRGILTMRTRGSGMALGCGVDHVFDEQVPIERRIEADEEGIQSISIIDAQPGVPVRVQKFAAYHTSHRTSAQELAFRVEQTLNRAIHVGIERLGQLQGERMQRFWDIADVKIDGCTDAQSMVRFNLFQLHQATARADGRGFPAKGRTGTGYEGQYFWDADIYVMPFLSYTQPQ